MTTPCKSTPDKPARGTARLGIPPRGWSHLWLALGLFLALNYTTTQSALSSPNERSRLYLTMALFEQQRFHIDAERLKFGAVLDQAQYAGHYFSDKAPGASLIALGPYAALRLFFDAAQLNIETMLGVIRRCVMVPIGIAGCFALEALAIAIGIGRGRARWAALAVTLASPAFHYSAAFFGHQIVATCFATALWRMVRQPALRGATAWLNAVVVGILLGVAGITEYQAVIGIALFCAYFIVTAQRRSLIIGAVLLGGLPFALWLGYYQSVCFGGPFELSYHHLADPTLSELHRRGVGGVQAPSAAALWGILGSLHRGLLATAPFFCLVPLGLVGLWRRGNRPLALLLGSMILGELGFVASSGTWEAGWGYGPRLLIPLLPMLGLLVAEALERARQSSATWGLGFSAWLVALLSFQSVTALFPEPPNELVNPWLDVVVPLARENAIAPNLFTRWFGGSGWWSVVPLVMLLAGFIAVLAAHTARAVGSWAWVKWLPLVPVLSLILVLTRGHSSDRRQRAEFVAFASALAKSPPRLAP